MLDLSHTPRQKKKKNLLRALMYTTTQHLYKWEKKMAGEQ